MMRLKNIEDGCCREFDLNRVYMDFYSLQIEASTWVNEPNNRLNIIFPDPIIHYQITQERYKNKLIYDVCNCQDKVGNFFEILSIEEYSAYLEEQSDGLFLFNHREKVHIYVLCFVSHIVEVLTYKPPILTYSFTEEWNKYNPEN